MGKALCPCEEAGRSRPGREGAGNGAEGRWKGQVPAQSGHGRQGGCHRLPVLVAGGQPRTCQGTATH